MKGPDFVQSLERGLAVVRAFDREHLRISELALRKPTLDDVFLSLTGHAAEEQPEDGEAGGEPVASGRGEEGR